MALEIPSSDHSLATRRALVTGGSMGIGRAIALNLARAGADVAIQFAAAADVALERADAAEQCCAEIGAMGRTAIAIATDFAQPGAARQAADHAIAALGGIDIMVIAASVQMRSAFADVRREDIDRQFAVNFAATIELLQAVLPAMAERGWGRVVSIGSVHQVAPELDLAVYGALKAAQHNLIVNLARTYAPYGVTLNTLSPGLIATDRNRWRRENAAAWAGIERAVNPMGRAGSPADLVGAALLLCSDAGAFITGADLPVDGGAHL